MWRHEAALAFWQANPRFALEVSLPIGSHYV